MSERIGGIHVQPVIRLKGLEFDVIAFNEFLEGAFQKLLNGVPVHAVVGRNS